jgi:5-methylcytosine-specific restriction endonuclease McrA
MPFERSAYPPEWPQIRARILERDQHRCQRCGVQNFSVGLRLEDGTFRLYVTTDSYNEGKRHAEAWGAAFPSIPPIVIVLACAHLENPDPMDCREENLKSLCQGCHSALDLPMRRRHVMATRLRKQREAHQYELFNVS